MGAGGGLRWGRRVRRRKEQWKKEKKQSHQGEAGGRRRFGPQLLQIQHGELALVGVGQAGAVGPHGDRHVHELVREVVHLSNNNAKKEKYR